MRDADRTEETELERRLRTALAAQAEAPDLADRRPSWDAALPNRPAGIDRRHFLVGAAAVSTVAAGAGITWAVARGDGGGQSVGVTADEPPTTTGGPRPAPKGWTKIPTAPLSDRMDPAVVWAGDRLIVWGNSLPIPGPPGFFALPPDGAQWDPVSNEWTPITPAPAGALPGGFAVWNGTEMLVGPTEAASGAPWNADVSEEDALYGLAAYDPAANSWRYIAPIASDATFGSDRRRQAAFLADRVLVAPRSASPDSLGRSGDLRLVDPSASSWESYDCGPFSASPYPDGSGEVALTAVSDQVMAAPDWDGRP